MTDPVPRNRHAVNRVLRHLCDRHVGSALARLCGCRDREACVEDAVSPLGVHVAITAGGHRSGLTAFGRRAQDAVKATVRRH